MPPKITDNYLRVPLQEIWIDRDARQRREIDCSKILSSVARRGILNPLLVEPFYAASAEYEHFKWKLVAGERRWKAAFELDLDSVPIRLFESLTPTEHQIVELEENIKRQDLSWQEEARAAVRIHELYAAQAQAEGREWYQQDTAEAIGVSDAWISVILLIAGHWANPGVSGATTQTEAHNFIKRLRDRQEGAALQEFIETVAERPAAVQTTEASSIFSTFEAPLVFDGAAFGQPTHIIVNGDKLPIESEEARIIMTEAKVTAPLLPLQSGIHNLSFLEWAPSYVGPKFNLLHCDFPYGINVFSGPQGREGGDNRRSDGGTEAYDDSPGTYFQLLDCFLTNIDRFALYSAHLVFWYSARHHQATMEAFAAKAPEWKFNLHPLIWHKSDNMGISPDARRTPRHIYETALVASRGDRKIVKIAGDCYSAPTDKTLHASAKPEPMLRHFFQMYVDETTSIFDPTCGSGSAIRAAESLGATRAVGLEIDPKHAEIAQGAYLAFRRKLVASRIATKSSSNGVKANVQTDEVQPSGIRDERNGEDRPDIGTEFRDA